MSGHRRHGKGNHRKALFPASCLKCGRRTDDGAVLCAACAPSFGQTHQTEAQRNAAQPARAHYRSARYQQNRARRFQMARCRCEDCGKKIGIEPRDWQCDHVKALVDCALAPSCAECRRFDTCPLDDVKNLRCRCIECAQIKTAADRRARRDGSRG